MRTLLSKPVYTDTLLFWFNVDILFPEERNSANQQSPKCQSSAQRHEGYPQGFQLFTNDQSYMFKVGNGQNAEQWVQCLQIAVARSQKDDISDIDSVHTWNRRISSDTTHSHKSHWSQNDMKNDNQRLHSDYPFHDQTKV